MENRHGVVHLAKFRQRMLLTRLNRAMQVRNLRCSGSA
eukprot:CAMPEP_0115140922 /NCGR_PEP_ID=MMETSP0227-20121206/59243_1 /TAXON_ID=89957 /ORGANISM="Polarella glacialis, Strain CCMP 1383" /LENGTH=37 /DNA_ID= /DNA_START= /DNA_END= /DNA_ORIENTATION=